MRPTALVAVVVSITLALCALGNHGVAAYVCNVASNVRRVDGLCNNLEHPEWGTGHTSLNVPSNESVFIRTEMAEYSNVTAMRSPRDNQVSPVTVGVDLVAYANDSVVRAKDTHNVAFYILLQFLVHDIVNTEIAPFDPFAPNTDAPILPDSRGRLFTLGRKSASHIDADGVPQQFNTATSFIDLSPVYGVNYNVSNALRAMVGGRLLTSNRGNFSYSFDNFPNLDLCECINTTTNQSVFKFNADGSNFNEVLDTTINGFAPEPFPPLNTCVSPAMSFGPGAVPGVYSCSFTRPPARLTDVQCSIRYDRLTNPKWAPYTWIIPDPTQWQPFVSQTTPPVPFNLINSQTTNPDKAFAAGDTRNTENLAILMYSQLFVRVHNARANSLAAAHPDWSDEKLFQEARRWNIALWQKIIYKELLRDLIGSKAYHKARFDKKYTAAQDYDPALDPRILNVFSTAAFRFHPTIPKVLFPANPQQNFSKIWAQRTQIYASLFGQNNPGDHSPYLFLPSSGQLTQFGPADDMMAYIAANLNTSTTQLRPDDVIMAGMIAQKADAFGRFVDRGLADLSISSCFTPSLFASVPALTVFRGRIHGLPGYHKLREVYGKSPVYGKKDCPVPSTVNDTDPLACFEYITQGDTALALLLQSTFRSLNLIDPWYGMLIENSVDFKENDAILGKTSAAIVTDQFERLKYGDRFWYENAELHQWTQDDLASIEATTLKSLIETHFPGLAGHLPDNILFGME